MAYNQLEDINKILNQYVNTLEDEITDIADNVATEGVQQLKNNKSTYTVRTGKYNRGWRVKKTSGKGYVNRTIHNATSYQLTHLLENGHATRNGGRTRAFKHIEPVEKYCIEKFTQEVEDAIRRGK